MTNLIRNDVIQTLEGTKVTPSVAGYRPKTEDSHKQCFECQFYVKVGDPESPCQKVTGLVQSDATCDLFKQRVKLAEEYKPSIQAKDNPFLYPAKAEPHQMHISIHLGQGPKPN